MDGICVGMDGGGTRTRALLTGPAGDPLLRMDGPPALIDAADPAAGAAVAAGLARSIAAAAGAQLPLQGLCCGLAGAGRPDVRDAVHALLADARLARSILVVSDAEAAMADAFGQGPGVLLIAGTGSIAWAGTGDGPALRVGGWGRVAGDEGSGYRMGADAIRAVLRAHDGRDGATSLTDPCLGAAGAASPEELVRFTATATKAQVAALAPLVLAAAADGDAAAGRIRADALEAILELVLTATRRLNMERPPIALAGGLLQPGGPLRDAVQAAIRGAVPGAMLLDRMVDAAAGAARIAREGGPSAETAQPLPPPS
jgi:glucosamine kinase